MSDRRMRLTRTLLGWLLSLSIPASAATFYVATTGNNANPGTLAQPFATIPYGYSVLAAGDTLYIRGGTYSGAGQVIGYPNAPPPSGTSWTNAVTIAGYPGETAIIDGNTANLDGIKPQTATYLIVQDLTVRHGQAYFTINETHHIRLQNVDVSLDPAFQDHNVIQGGGDHIEIINCKVHGSRTGYGLYVWGHDNLYDGNEVYGNGGYGFHVFQSGQTYVNNNIFRNNYIHDNGGGAAVATGGMILSSGGNNIAYNNLIVRQVNGVGIQLSYNNGMTNNQAYNNTIYGNALAGIYVDSTAPQSVVQNNIVYGNGDVIVNTGSAGAVLSDNLCNSSGPGCSIIGNPVFVNAAGDNYALQAGSPAINAGVTISSVLTDIVGVTRPQGAAYDIGAYEFVSSDGSVPTLIRIIR